MMISMTRDIFVLAKPLLEQPSVPWWAPSTLLVCYQDAQVYWLIRLVNLGNLWRSLYWLNSLIRCEISSTAHKLIRIASANTEEFLLRLSVRRVGGMNFISFKTFHRYFDLESDFSHSLKNSTCSASACTQLNDNRKNSNLALTLKCLIRRHKFWVYGYSLKLFGFLLNINESAWKLCSLKLSR